jgi:hypothetical protein
MRSVFFFYKDRLVLLRVRSVVVVVATYILLRQKAGKRVQSKIGPPSLITTCEKLHTSPEPRDVTVHHLTLHYITLHYIT